MEARATTLDTRRLAGWTGIAAGLLFGVGSAIWGLDMPDGGAPADTIVAFYRDTADRIVVGASLSLLSLAVFVVFAAALRRLLADAEGGDVLATAAFGGAMLGLAAGLSAESINMVGALRAQDGDLTAPLAQSLFEISQIFGSVAGGVGLGTLALITGAAALRAGGVLPRWLASVTLLVGVALLTPLSYLNEVPGAAVVILGLAVGGALLRGRPT